MRDSCKYLEEERYQMPTFRPIKQSRISREVTEQLKHAILLGHFRTGDKLPPERELAEQFQVSRVAVRESLRVLESAGFLTTRQGVTGGAEPLLVGLHAHERAYVALAVDVPGGGVAVLLARGVARYRVEIRFLPEARW